MPNGFENEDDAMAVKYVEDLNQALDELEEGRLYCRFFTGDREGSIAKLVPERPVDGRAEIVYHLSIFNQNLRYRVEVPYVQVRAKWTGRSNKPKFAIPYDCREMELLIGYDGPTVWKKFDAQEAKEHVLRDGVELPDIDGQTLRVGDEVLYVNIRYGRGTKLCHGTVKRFDVSVDSKRTEVSIVIEGSEGELSTIADPSTMVWRK